MNDIIQLTDYLKSRQHNPILLDKLGNTLFRKDVNHFNALHDRRIKVSWDMCAKTGRHCLFIEMVDGDELSDEVVYFITRGELGRTLEEWFGATLFEEDCYGKDYVTAHLSF